MKETNSVGTHVAANRSRFYNFNFSLDHLLNFALRIFALLFTPLQGCDNILQHDAHLRTECLTIRIFGNFRMLWINRVIFFYFFFSKEQSTLNTRQSLKLPSNTIKFHDNVKPLQRHTWRWESNFIALEIALRNSRCVNIFKSLRCFESFQIFMDCPYLWEFDGPKMEMA